MTSSMTMVLSNAARMAVPAHASSRCGINDGGLGASQLSRPAYIFDVPCAVAAYREHINDAGTREIGRSENSGAASAAPAVMPVSPKRTHGGAAGRVH